MLHIALLCLAFQTPAPADILKAVNAKLAAAQTLTGGMTVTFPGQKPQSWSFKFMKPNLYKIISSDQEFRSDGMLEYVYLPSQRRFRVTERKGKQITDAPFALGLNAFFTGASPAILASAKSVVLDKKQLLAIQSVQPEFAKATLYEDPVTGLPF